MIVYIVAVLLAVLTVLLFLIFRELCTVPPVGQDLLNMRNALFVVREHFVYDCRTNDSMILLDLINRTLKIESPRSTRLATPNIQEE